MSQTRGRRRVHDRGAENRLQGEIETRIDSKQPLRSYVGGPMGGRFDSHPSARTPLDETTPAGRTCFHPARVEERRGERGESPGGG